MQPVQKSIVIERCKLKFITMKKLLILFCLIVPVFLNAQEEENENTQDDFHTVFGNKKVKVSGFAGLLMDFTTIDNNFAHMLGGGGGVIVNNFFFGGYGMGLTTEIPYSTGGDEVLTFGHGGFWYGFFIKHKWAIHPCVHVKTGWGSVGSKYPGEEDGYERVSSDDIFVVIPAFELEANISRFFKVGAGAGYTFLYGSTTEGYYSESFQKPTVQVSFKFGWFQ